MRFVVRGTRASDGLPVATSVFALDEQHARLIAKRLGVPDAVVEPIPTAEQALAEALKLDAALGSDPEDRGAAGGRSS